ncbi:(Fe-S)-binding protein [Daejeonella oryzae]|uniref:(Fe-S)-binding protein n=1 Tax=Daejeonella oryzae TaxID=1122943 RepID=UPI00040FA804|nr:(Fe-S)-binding protein [Daejeonella oryzae]
MIAQLIFLLFTIAAVVLFTINVRKIIRNINLGRPLNRSDRKAERLMVMLKVAFGQTKMTKKPVAAILHFFVYVGFIIINLEVLEIIIDGLFGTHRIFAAPLGGIYSFLIGSFEILAALVLVGVIAFYARRNFIRLKRFTGVEMTSWPKSDANYILIIETLLMAAFLIMNAADYRLQQLGSLHYIEAGAFPISGLIAPYLPSSESALIMIERSCWWFHILGILAFLNYLPYSKHFHILLAFPNTYYSNLEPKGEFSNMASVSNEVKAMLDPSYTPEPIAEGGKFGAKDINDLSWKSLMEAYTCTECGRCTSACPANMTGKLLSPRKIMMDTRDRMEEVGKNIDKHGKDFKDDKSLLGNYISQEEIWACTTCNACTEACPVNIDPLSIIMELRRFSVMEESQAPASLNAMLGNVENNGAPWKYSPADRLNWAETK